MEQICDKIEKDANHILSQKRLSTKEEKIMPHIEVKMFPGRNDEIKKNLAEKLLKTAAEELKIGEENLSVSIEDIDPKVWNETVAKATPEEKIYAGKMFQAE